jgi:ABC-type oligopeptide transport system substrate-binding subunit
LPTDFGVIVDKVFTPTAEGTLDFQMYIPRLAWQPGSADVSEAFWAGGTTRSGRTGDNATGYNNPEFNALIEEFNQAQTTEDAFDIMWQLEDIFFVDKPFILLFDTGIIEAYRSASITFRSDTLSGLRSGNGFSVS